MKNKTKALPLPHTNVMTPLMHLKHQNALGKFVTSWLYEAGFEGELVIRSVGDVISGFCYVFKNEGERSRRKYLEEILKHLVRDYFRCLSPGDIQYTYTSFSVEDSK